MASENLAGRTVDNYSLLELIGEGGTATVYKASHPEHEQCAVKILKERFRNDETAVERFLREAGFGSRVVHPGVVKTFAYGDEGNLYYLALEWAEGVPLSKYINKHGRIQPKIVASVVNQISGALGAAHAAGIIHRDLKPDNIIYNPETEVAKLLDFGIARDAEVESNERLTRAGFFVGTLQYVAPEALSGELVGEKADTYSMAKIAYYMLTAENPHNGKSPREMFQKLLNEEATPLNQAVKGVKYPANVEQVVMKSLAKNPDDRHPTVKNFAEDFVSAIENPGGDDDSGFMGSIKGLFSRKN